MRLVVGLGTWIVLISLCGLAWLDIEADLAGFVEASSSSFFLAQSSGPRFSWRVEVALPCEGPCKCLVTG